MHVEALAREVVNVAYRLYREAGPGLLETVYEIALVDMLRERGLEVKNQVPVPMRLGNRTFEVAFRADILVEQRLLVELKSIERFLPVHAKQTLTYLRLLDLPLGLLLNFGAPTFRDGIRRVVLGHRETAGSSLRIHTD